MLKPPCKASLLVANLHIIAMFKIMAARKLWRQFIFSFQCSLTVSNVTGNNWVVLADRLVKSFVFLLDKNKDMMKYVVVYHIGTDFGAKTSMLYNYFPVVVIIPRLNILKLYEIWIHMLGTNVVDLFSLSSK